MTYNKPVDETVAAIMNATKPFTRSELEKIFGGLYNAGYDEGHRVGAEFGYIEGYEDGREGYGE